MVTVVNLWMIQEEKKMHMHNSPSITINDIISQSSRNDICCFLD